jgi:hypothetical protein
MIDRFNSYDSLGKNISVFNDVFKILKAQKDPLYQKNIIFEIILNDNKLRAGLGDFSNAYSNKASDGTAYRLGIRPMPGITNIDVKSKGAYGSLREATVNFQCWDIKQLEELELLYMRPGYSVLLEWGWTPFLDNNNKYTTRVEYTDIIDTAHNKEELFRLQYAKSADGNYVNEKGEKQTTKGYQGNYDAMYGTIKNYGWTARMDGGYDCHTSIVSMGEIMESLKINYSHYCWCSLCILSHISRASRVLFKIS